MKGLVLMQSPLPPLPLPFHAVQIAETYAFLPREAVTRFLMSCGECQKRMHINPSGAEFKGTDPPPSTTASHRRLAGCTERHPQARPCAGRSERTVRVTPTVRTERRLVKLRSRGRSTFYPSCL